MVRLTLLKSNAGIVRAAVQQGHAQTVDFFFQNVPDLHKVYLTSPSHLSDGHIKITYHRLNAFRLHPCENGKS